MFDIANSSSCFLMDFSLKFCLEEVLKWQKCASNETIKSFAVNASAVECSISYSYINGSYKRHPSPYQTSLTEIQWLNVTNRLSLWEDYYGSGRRKSYRVSKIDTNIKEHHLIASAWITRRCWILYHVDIKAMIR